MKTLIMLLLAVAFVAIAPAAKADGSDPMPLCRQTKCLPPPQGSWPWDKTPVPPIGR
jgi:hypothetical protein